jgi:hypothetical protein
MDPRAAMLAWTRRSRADRLARLVATPREVAAALVAAPRSALAHRPAADAWAPVEIVCHLRDLEESFHERVALILTTNEPRFPTTNPDRWCAERQYARQDAHEAARAFARRRTETLALFDGLDGDTWVRAGWQLDSRGRRTVDDFLALIAWHDDNHLAQLTRALDGRP